MINIVGVLAEESNVNCKNVIIVRGSRSEKFRFFGERRQSLSLRCITLEMIISIHIDGGLPNKCRYIGVYIRISPLYCILLFYRPRRTSGVGTGKRVSSIEKGNLAQHAHRYEQIHIGCLIIDNEKISDKRIPKNNPFARNGCNGPNYWSFKVKVTSIYLYKFVDQSF